MAIEGLKGIDFTFPSLSETGKAGKSDNITIPFADYLKEALNNTNELLQQSESLKTDFAAGRIDNIEEVLIAGEKAEIALQFTMQIRNKIMDAYNEIMRMQI